MILPSLHDWNSPERKREVVTETIKERSSPVTPLGDGRLVTTIEVEQTVTFEILRLRFLLIIYTFIQVSLPLVFPLDDGVTDLSG